MSSRLLMTAYKADTYGSLKMALHYARGLIAAGHRLTFAYEMVPNGDPTDRAQTVVPDLIDAGADVVQLDLLCRAFVPGVCPRLGQLVREADLVMNCQRRDLPSMALLTQKYSVRSLACIQNSPVFEGNYFSKKFKRWLYQTNLRDRVGHIMTCAGGVTESLIDEFGIPAEKVTTICNSFDLDTFVEPTGDERDSVRAEFSVSDDEFLLLNLGRIDEQKGQDILIEALAHVRDELPPMKIVLAGAPRPGNEGLVQKYQQLAIDRGVDDLLIWAGFRDDGMRLLAACDLFILPSRWEGLPVAILEAFASRKPVLMTEYSTRLDGFIDGQHGWYVPKNDPVAFGKALAEVLKRSPVELEQIGRASRVYLEENLTLRDAVEKFVALCESQVFESQTKTTVCTN